MKIHFLNYFDKQERWCEIKKNSFLQQDAWISMRVCADIYSYLFMRHRTSATDEKKQQRNENR